MEEHTALLRGSRACATRKVPARVRAAGLEVEARSSGADDYLLEPFGAPGCPDDVHLGATTTTTRPTRS
jgi:hypothetical protein